MSISTPYFCNSQLTLGCTVDVLSPERDEQILRIASELCPHLFAHNGEEEKKETEVSFEVKPLLGGLSNELFILSRKDLSTSPVLIRINPDEGDSDDGVVNRDVENHVAAWLAQQGIAPVYYGRFENGRIEEFYDNVAPLSSSTMDLYAPQIATIMAKFHSLQAPSEVLPKPSTRPAMIYQTLDRWMEQAVLLEAKMPSHNMELLKRLEHEWKWLNDGDWLQKTMTTTNVNEDAQTQALKFIRQIVVTHMDCQSLNFLKDQEKNTIRVIDFEYAGWNPRAVDIANTFCEYCDMNNISADFEKEYPSDAQQDAYLIPYIRQAEPRLAEQMEADPTGFGAEFLATLRQEIGRFTLVSHLGWAVWSVIKSKEDSAIDFDYIKYAHHRMDGYQFAKNKFFSSQ